MTTRLPVEGKDRFAVIAAWLVVLVGLVVLIATLRNDTTPTAERGTTLQAYVSGATATFTDFAAAISGKLPWFILAIVGLSFVLLLISTSSVSRSTAGSFPTWWLIAGRHSAAGIRNPYVPCLVRHQEGLNHS